MNNIVPENVIGRAYYDKDGCLVTEFIPGKDFSDVTYIFEYSPSEYWYIED